MNAVDRQSTYEVDVRPLSEDERVTATAVETPSERSDGVFAGTAKKAGLALGVCAFLGCAVVAVASAATFSYAVYIGVPLMPA